MKHKRIKAVQALSDSIICYPLTSFRLELHFIWTEIGSVIETVPGREKERGKDIGHEVGVAIEIRNAVMEPLNVANIIHRLLRQTFVSVHSEC